MSDEIHLSVCVCHHVTEINISQVEINVVLCSLFHLYFLVLTVPSIFTPPFMNEMFLCFIQNK